MTTEVLFASMRSRSLNPDHSFVGKYRETIQKLGIPESVKDKNVMIKLHLGSHLGFTTVHPFLVGELARLIKKAGGRPFAVDTIEGFYAATARGYTPEVIGCPIFPVAGPRENYFLTREINYKSISEIKLGGTLQDADVLVDLSHVKGHNTEGFGAAIKNLAIGMLVSESRSKMHDVMQFDRYWFSEKCENPRSHTKLCPFGALKYNEKKMCLSIDFDMCNQCMRCVEATKQEGCLQVNQVNFASFPEANALSTKETLSFFDEKERFYINVGINITVVCDCWGITTGNILPDLGVLGSRDIVAIDKATLDLLADKPLIQENVPQCLEIVRDGRLHPFQEVHGPYKDPYLLPMFCEKYGLGKMKYEITEIQPPAPEAKLTPSRFPKPKKLF